MGSQWQIFRPTESIEGHGSGSHGVQGLETGCIRHRVTRHIGLSRVVVLICLKLRPTLVLEARLFLVLLPLLLAGETAIQRKSEVSHEETQHSTGAGKAGFGLGAVMNVVWVMRHVAVFGNVPGSTVLRVMRVRQVAGGLKVDRDDPED